MQLSYKRIAVCYAMAVLLLFICAFRVFSVMKEEKYSQTAETISRRTVNLGYSRGSIFDCKMNRITNSNEIYYAVIFDEPTAIATLYNYFTGAEIESVCNEIRQNGFAVRRVARVIESEGIYCFKAYSQSDDSIAAKHIVGYTDSTGRGVCGIEASFDELLSCSEQNKVSFSISGQGKVLSGSEPELSYNYEAANNGVMLTLDVDIQRIAEQKSMDINCGAVVVCEIETGKIRALVSRPDYKLSDLGAAIEDEGEPLLNRSLCTYNVGSVFKPLVAAAGYEKGVSQTVRCNGYTNIDGLSFACHKLGGHGEVDLSLALKVSCNCFFYNFIQKIGGDAVFSMARLLGFSNSVYLAENLYAASGSLGNTQTASQSKRTLANVSIGQGELMVSPIAITNLYMAIANGGVYRTPSLVEGRVENGELASKEPPTAEIRVMSDATALRLKKDLVGVLEEGGTGDEAMPTKTTAAGKTGTAQTGVVKQGKKVTNSWFCGFFPLDNPKYAVTILSENAPDGCSGIFARIADSITEYEEISGN